MFPRIFNQLQKATLLIQQNRLNDADKLLTQLLINDSSNFEVLYLKGVVCGMRLKHEDCKKYLLKALNINSNHAFIHFNLAQAMSELGEDKQSLVHHEKAVNLMPTNSDAWLNYGKSLSKVFLPKESLKCCNIAIELNPNFSEAYYFRGNVLNEINLLEEALLSYDSAIRLNPSYTEAYFCRGIVLNRLNLLHESILSYDKAIELKPSFIEAHFNKGYILSQLNRFEEALLSYNHTIQLDQGHYKALVNRGEILHLLNRLDEALISYRKAIQLKEDTAEAYLGQGIVLVELKLFDDAIISYKKAIELKHDYYESYFNISLVFLLLGNFYNGFELYEYRHFLKSSFRARISFNHKVWLGEESLTNKTILLYSEQGLGDTIQFSRYVKYVKELGPKVILQVQKPLLKLLKNLEGADVIIDDTEITPDFDFQCPLMSLPLVFKTDLNSIPTSKIYLGCKYQKIDMWKQRLGQKTKPRIGLVWSGSNIHKNDRNRSLSLVDLIKYLPANFDYVSLQKYVSHEDINTLLNRSIKHFEEDIIDFSDTAALCLLMDLVISVDTSVAHLSGSLGQKTWILLPHVPDWRWLLERDDSPWYESVKLYRQYEDRQYNSVLKRIASDLCVFNFNI